MRIIAVNRFYRPDHSATAQLLGDLAEYLAACGHDVTIVTSRLRYEGGERLANRETIAGVKVRRIWTTHFGRGNLVGRAFDYLTFYISAFFAMLAAGRRGTVLVAKTDPPLISVPAGWACRLKGMKLVNWCQDLFPEIAGALGLGWARGPVGSATRWARNRSLRMAAVNVALNQAMADRLAGQGVARERISVIANWPEASLRPVARTDNALRAAWGYKPGTFVIGYSGNLGRAHMPETIARLVKASAAIDDLAWLFIGGGAGLATLKEQVGHLPNVAFRPYQPIARLSESLSVPDAHLVSLDPDCEGLIMPSKLYGILAVDRPALVLGEDGEGMSLEVKRLGAGITLDCDADDNRWVAQLRDFIAGQAPGRAVRSLKPRHGAEVQARQAREAWCACLLAQVMKEQAGAARRVVA